jgi:mannosyltransferase OCH1-like enzyme
MSDIPKIIHLAWKNKDILKNESPLIVNGIRKLVDMNTDWQVEINTDEEIDSYLVDTIEKKDYELIKNAHIVAKTDIWRLIKLYVTGGLYMDIDRFCNVELSNLASENVKWVLPTNASFDLSHDFMMTAPNNPAFLNAINLYLHRRSEGNNNVYFLGPQTYMHAVTEVLCGEMINTNPGEKKFNEIRNKIKESSFIKTYCETSPHDTIIYKHKDGDEKLDLEVLKRQFYASENIKHWTNEW